MNSLASTNRARRVLMALAAVSGIGLLVACSSGTGIGRPNPTGFTNSSLSGTYIFSVSGSDVNATSESFFAIAGTLTADGKGNITGGTVDVIDPNLGGTGIFLGQAVSASTYSISQDGRGTGSLATPVGTFGLDFVLTSTSHGLIIRFDGIGSGSGTLDLQGSASQSSLASLVFSLSGINGINPFGTVGAFTLNSSGTITSGIQDFNNNNSSSASGLNGAALTGSVVLNSGTSGTAQLNSSFGPLTFDFWVVDSSHLKLIETDASGLILIGDAFTQQTSFTAGQLVFTLGGNDSGFNPLAIGGFVTTDANGTLSNGTEDFNDAGNANTVTNFSGSCSAPAPFPSGRCQLSLNGFSNGSSNNFIFAAYPSSGGIQLLEIDNLGLTQGAAFAQTATSFAAASYALNLSGANTDGRGNVGEVDDVAQFNATTATNNNMTGSLDENTTFVGPIHNSSLSGTYTPDSPATGRGAISVSTPRTFIGGLSLEYYVVNSSSAVFIEVDNSQLSVGSFEAQSPGSAGAALSRITIRRPAVRSHASWMRK